MDHVKSHFFISEDGSFFKVQSVLVLRPTVYGSTTLDNSSTLLFTAKDLLVHHLPLPHKQVLLAL